MDKFKLEFVTPEKQIMSDDVEQVILPGSEGEFTILANHSPIISSLRPGFIKIFNGDNDNSFDYFVTEGFVDMTSSELTILAQESIERSDLDSIKINAFIESYQNQIDETNDEEKKNKYNIKIEHLKVIQASL
tara:strand:+ start:1434 stop:1832 length:399 start_codon:yes stop_codon:yes gene_type:complete